MKTKLKPCLWCGRYPVLEQNALTERYRVRCLSFDCKRNPSTREFVTVEEANDSWGFEETEP